MSSPQIPMEGTSLTVLTSHYALLEDAATTQLGPLAGRIVRKLGERGNMTLKEISQSLLGEPFQASTTALEAACAVGSNLTASDGRAKPRGGEGASLEPTVLIDTAVKEMMTRLVLHRIVAATAYQATYELRLGCGVLLHVLHPLLAHAARCRYGPAGEAVVLVVRQLAVVPLDAAAALAKARCPSLRPTDIDRAAASLAADGWLERLDGEMEVEATSAEANRKRGRGTDEGHGGAAAVSHYPCRLCLPVLLRELLHDALGQWVSEHFPDTGLSTAIATALFRSMYKPVDPVADSHTTSQSTQRGINSSGEHGILVTNPFGFPPLAVSAFSEPLTAGAVANVLSQSYEDQRRESPFAHASREEVAAALRKMATPTSSNGGVEGPILRLSSSSAVGGAHQRDAGMGMESYSLHLRAVVSALQFGCCERTVFSRHGVLGVRLMKLLLRHHLLEDRTLAEEAVATQPRTRHTLSAMMRDGYMYQQEVPRSAITGDRQPKNSIFLWGCSMRQSVTPVVREQLANTLLHAIAKLREVVYTANNSEEGTAALLPGSEAQGTDPERIRRVVREQRNAIGMESCAMALMRMLLIMDYYQ